jgi:methyl-accepting chemotaxis protein
MKLRSKILTFSLMPVIATLGAVMAITTIRTFAKSSADALLQMEALSKGYAAEIDAELEVAMDTARTLAQIFEGYEALDLDERRADFSNMLKTIVEKNPLFIGASTCWEPNVLDGRDSQYANTRGHDATGRFIPYWSRFGGSVELSALVDYDKEGAGDWYLIPMRTGREQIIEPYEYTDAGKTILLTSLMVPIKDSGGNSIGVVGIDIALDDLKNRFSSIKYGRTGFGRFLSSAGINIAHPDPKQVNKPWGESKDKKDLEIFQRLKNGETFSMVTYSESLGKDVQKSFSPIFIGKAELPWIFSMVIPGEEILESAYQLAAFILALAGVGVVLIGVIVFFLALSITRPVVAMADILKEISEGEGDLTMSIEVKSKDEIGDMAKYFNLTFSKIRSLVAMVKRQSATLKDVGIDLSSNMTETAAAINEIAANILSIKNQTMNQSASVTETSATMEQISKGIDKLNRLIEDQSANVTESSSAIEEMMANIGSVAQTLVRNTGNIKRLAESSEAGKSVLDTIAVAIKDVAKESDGLMEISQIIQDIASQTNLLSMNAAIEAAHAGESGKGFAVVADEIRKLAESSSTQTKTIGTVLKKIRDSIAVIIKYSEEVVAKFTTIEADVRTVSEQEDGIRRAMEEQSEGSKQVLEAITILNGITQKVQASSLEMLTGSNQVLKEARSMNAITQEITGGMNEMASGADQVTSAVNTVNELSVENKASIDALVAEVNKFKV